MPPEFHLWSTLLLVIEDLQQTFQPRDMPASLEVCSHPGQPSETFPNPQADGPLASPGALMSVLSILSPVFQFKFLPVLWDPRPQLFLPPGRPATTHSNQPPEACYSCGLPGMTSWLKTSTRTQSTRVCTIWHHQNTALLLQQDLDMLNNLKNRAMTLNLILGKL
jgi:hypothetical protein